MIDMEGKRVELTSENYYSQEANEQFFSVSQYKDFMKCESMAMAKIRGEYQQPMTRALLVGSFVDAYFEGTLPQFMERNPEIFTRKNELKSEFRKANEIIARVTADPVFSQFMGGEKQRIMTFELFNAPWKMKMDSYLKGICIADLKVVANFKSLPLWRYDLQGAVYQAGVEAVTGEQLPFYLAVASKERVVDLDIFQIPQTTLNLAMDEIGFSIGHYIEVKAGLTPPKACGRCDYCKSVKQARIRNYNELLEG
ncbi:PD-(D/E)XK nuclease-like domain-containing protein [Lacrimispora sp. 210928-DFI.3.58]|uniref:PD-(D/E)XK nuclease-like domain-containing protein n=1 Tax=Lacrimispora sp. 210928-DFI.3.58 TaxID=2883214 RepID=UPI001D086467|nr:PD-(D/E)XK nuclease-like domain-containing protein [Lacrimispora sp. 210928-DFI.3.58]